MAARMDHFYLLQRLRQAAAAEEAIRLARDLHDGLLQSLTAAALELQTVHGLLPEKPEMARDRLGEVQRLIAAEQRDLRSFITVLKPVPLAATEAEASLAARLDELAKWVERQWGLRVELKVEPTEARISDGLAQQTYLMIHEALVNAARHAQASAARVELGAHDGRLSITVADNGRGFPFRGRYDHAALAEHGLGPASLKGRIASLGGSLAIDSAESGARLEITLPLSPPGASDAH